MPDKNTTNLPILDDIIVPGDTVKAVHKPSSRVQSSLRGSDEAADSPSINIYANTDSPAAVDDQPDISALFADDQTDDNVNDQLDISIPKQPDQPFSADKIQNEAASADQQAAQPSSIDACDIDALTMAILYNVMPELEQVLTEKIQHALKQHLSGQTKSS